MCVSPHLAVVSPEVEVGALRGGPVSPAVAGGEGDPHDAPGVPCGQPALLIAAPPAHGPLLLAAGHAALPGQAQDVGVTAQDGPELHRRKHACFYERFTRVHRVTGLTGGSSGSG